MKSFRKSPPLCWFQQQDRQLLAVYHLKYPFADHKPEGTRLLPSNYGEQSFF